MIEFDTAAAQSPAFLLPFRVGRGPLAGRWDLFLLPFRAGRGPLAGRWEKLLVVALLTALAVAVPASKAHAAERSLDGIRIFSPVSVVLKRFGDPTFITSGTEDAIVGYGPDDISVQSPDNGAAAPAMAAPTPGMISADDDLSISYENASRYFYVFADKGLALAFIVSSDGRVIGIQAIGYHGDIRTSEGIGLGSTYEQIIFRYGYPEKQTNDIGAPQGNTLTLSYMQRAHVVFRMVHNRVALISVTAAE